MDNHPKDNPAKKAGEEKWLNRFAKEMTADIAYDKQTWGNIDENLIAAYISGVCTEEEKTRVEKAMVDYPAVRECVEMALDMKKSELDEMEAGSGPKQSEGRLWAGRAEHPKNEPGPFR